MGMVFLRVLALSPTPLEDNPTPALDPGSLVQNAEETLATGIPSDRVPEYAVDQFNYVSTYQGERQWRLEAVRAYLFNKEKIVHSRQVVAFLYASDGSVTVVTSKEAKYKMNERDIEMFGNVRALFPDGFEIRSEYMRYRPARRFIEVPVRYLTHGKQTQERPIQEPPEPKSGSSQTPTPTALLSISGSPSPLPALSGGPTPTPTPTVGAPLEQKISFTSYGLDYWMDEQRIFLKQQVHFEMEKIPPPTEEGASVDPAMSAPGVPDITTIDSDHCMIYRDKRVARFTMSPSRPASTRFVKIAQPTLFARARRSDLNYGDFSKMLQYMVAYDDVLIRELPESQSETGQAKKPGPAGSPSPRPTRQPNRYSTCGRAEFDTQQDTIVLTNYPQVYQDGDTVTGEVITVHRDSDLVEIEKSNSFSEGGSE